MLGRLAPIATLFAALFIDATPALAQDMRVALVIGNSAYKHTPRLKNPRNDAADMAAKLEQVGFEVIKGHDLDKAAMDRTVRDFAEKLSGADVGLFFYAGHGLQVSGRNYLVPIDAKLTTAAAIDFEMVRLDLVHRTMERETRTNILIMDACRDNPLARNLARALGTRSAQIGRGLATVESGEGTLISFSTQPGNVALDGTGRNSPFAAAFIKHVVTPGEDLPTILINVRNDVMRATRGRQVPWEHSAMTARFYFIPPAPTLKSTPQDLELAFWMSVKDSTSPVVLDTYLDRYPNGQFAPIAQALIAHYEQKRKAENAMREEASRRQEEQRKAAEVKRLEDERRAREEAIAEERRRAEEAKRGQDLKRLDELAKVEWLTRTEELLKALEEARLARDAAKAAEKQRMAAAKAAGETTKAAKETIARKREADEAAGDTTKVAALPRMEQDLGVALQRELQRVGCYRGGIDGVWGPASRTAVADFNRHAKMALHTDQPEEPSLSALRKVFARICPEPQPEMPTRRAPAYNPHDFRRRVTPGGYETCGPKGCQFVPQGCRAVRGMGGGGRGGKIFCP